MEETTVEAGKNLLCITCGYDLRELSRDGVCPECGLAITRSENSDPLARADPEWLTVVARGLGLYLAGQLSIMMGIFGILGFFIFSVAFSTARTPSWLNLFFIGFALLMTAVGLLLMCIGTVMLASPDPGRKEEYKGLHIRLLARFAMPGIIIIPAIIFATYMFPPTAFLSMIVQLLFHIEIVWGGFAVAMVMLYVAHLIERIPMDSLQAYMTKAARFLLWAAPVFGMTSWLQQVWSPAGVGSNFGVSSLMFGLSCIFLLLGIFLLGTFIHQGLMMIRFKRAVCSCRDFARQLNDNLAEVKHSPPTISDDSS